MHGRTDANKGREPFTAVPPSFYFIFTLRAEMLTACRDDAAVRWRLLKLAEGAPTRGGSRALLGWAKSRAAADAGGGVDQHELARFVKRVVQLFTEGFVATEPSLTTSLPEACPLLREARPGEGFARSVDLFDFSERKSLRNAVEVVTAVGGQRLQRRLLVLPVGDALQEPFWPEGLGVNRGMHNGLDACWAAHRWGDACGDAARQAEVVDERQWLYERQTLQMHGKHRAMLQGYNADNSKGTSPRPAYTYSPDPASRYNQTFAG